jgi:PmbA protein
LALTCSAPTGGGPLCVANGFEQDFGKIERHQLGIPQLNELDTQVLQPVSIALAHALAGLVVLRAVVVVFASGQVFCLSQGTAALHQAAAGTIVPYYWVTQAHVMQQAPADDTGIAQLKDVIEFVLKEAARQGATQAAADASINQGLGVTARLGEVETVEYQRDRGIGVTVYFGTRKGSASTADLGMQAVRDTVEKACTIARYTAEDPYAGLVDPEALARDIPNLDLDHPWALKPEQAIELALRCEAAGRGVDTRVTNSEGATVNTQRHIGVYGNSLGFLSGTAGTSHSISCSLIAQHADEMQRDYWYSSARDSAELDEPESIGRRAGERAVARLGSRKLTTRKAPIAYSPDMARGLFRHFIGAIRGASQYRKASFLLDAAGKDVFPAFLQMQERPHILKGLASAPFDGEGAATHDRDLIRDGVLQGYVLGSYSARKLGLKTTGNAGGVHNLIVAAPGKALDMPSFLARMKTGLLVTEMMGQGVNGVTGDYSRGASGFWVEDGVIAYPVHEITIAGNLKDMYKNIVALGNDVDVRGGIRTGSVLIEEMTIAGN